VWGTTLGNNPEANVFMPTGDLQFNLSTSLENETAALYIFGSQLF
jgi:hypothetical protein